MLLGELESLELEAARRGYRVRFERVTECVLPPDGEPGCATLDEANALLERVTKVAAAGGIRMVRVVHPDGSEVMPIITPNPPGSPQGTPLPLPPADTRLSEPMPPTGPLRMSRDQLANLGAAVERINSLPREPSERLRALQADADDAEEMGAPV